MSKAKTTSGQEPSHLDVANQIAACRRSLLAGVASYREKVSSPFGTRKVTDDDAWMAWHLLSAISGALAGFRSWDRVRSAYAGMTARPGAQTRQDAARERCEEVLAAWRGLDRRRRRGESESERAARLEAVATEERWLTKALTHALRELRYAPKNVGPLLAKTAKRSNGSALTLAKALLDLSEDQIRNAKRKKRQTRS